MSEYPDPLSFSLIDRLGRRTDGNGYPRPDINDTQSLITRLTSEPRTLKQQLAPGLPPRLTPTSHTATEPPVDDALVYPDPTPDPNIKPKNPHLRPPPTPEVFRHLKHQFLPDVKVIPVVGGVDPSDEDGDEDRENQTPSNDEDLLMLSLRSPTLRPTPMTLLINCVSALCADWNAILPGIAHSTCVGDASRLNLDIHLHTALTNEGLAELHAEGLVRVQTLCWMITVMTMNLTRISEESAEESVHNCRGDVDFLFVGADLQKVQRFEDQSSVDTQMAMGWQPAADIPTTLMLWSVDEMPNMSYDYDMELYGDGES
uniref:Reverse transcriptase-rnase h-integrase n=1 Tax=Moniliophthora roreri TaxID=221103 RepID=A0A0W0G1C6_MONRR